MGNRFNFGLENLANSCSLTSEEDYLACSSDSVFIFCTFGGKWIGVSLASRGGLQPGFRNRRMCMDGVHDAIDGKLIGNRKTHFGNQCRSLMADDLSAEDLPCFTVDDDWANPSVSMAAIDLPSA